MWTAVKSSQRRWAVFRGWKNLTPYRWHFAGLALLSCAEVLFRLLLPWPMKLVVDHALGTLPPPSWLRIASGGSRPWMLGIAVAGGVAVQAAHQSVLMAHTRVHVTTGHQLTRDLRQRLFVHLQSLGLRHHSRMPVGEAVYRLEADATYLDDLLVRGVMPMVFSAITLVVMFGVMLRMNALLAMVSLAVIPPLFMWIRWSAQRIRPRADRSHTVESRLTARLQESFAAIRLVKSFAREPYEGHRFASAADDVMQARLALSTREAWYSLVLGNLIVVGTALVLFVGGMQVLAGRMTVGTLLIALAYLGFVYGPLVGIANTTATIQQARARGARVREAFSLATEMDDGVVTASRFRGELRFTNVSFSYDDRPILRQVNLVVHPGELIALVGPSGAGKTTLVSLLPRFYDADGGELTIDGQPVERYRLRSLREHIAIVQQEVIVLSGTIRDNLRYGRLDVTDAAIEQAARDAGALDFISRLPLGLDTPLAEAGVGLSGGERQRLSIARAFLKDAPILILDEPSSALDAMSERLVFEAVERLRRGRTTLVIAHRLSTVRAADRIVVMVGGEIVGTGTHEELLEQLPLYRTLAGELTKTGVSA